MLFGLNAFTFVKILICVECSKLYPQITISSLGEGYIIDLYSILLNFKDLPLISNFFHLSK